MSAAVTAKSHRDQILTLLDDPKWAEKSNAEIAEKVGCHEGTVVRAKAARKRPPSYPVEDVRIEDLDLDAGTQTRPEIDIATRDDYLERLRDGDEPPPIGVVRTKDGRLIVWDGFHRIDCAILDGRETIKASVRPGTVADAIALACAANADHGLPRDTETKRNAVRMYKKHHDGASVAEIAKAVKVSWAFADGVLKGRDGVAPRPDWTPAAQRNGHAGNSTDRPADPEPLAREADEPADDRDDEPLAREGTTAKPKAKREREAGSDDDKGEGSTAEEEFLADLPLSKALAGKALETFQQDALLYLRTFDARKAFGDSLSHHARKPRPGHPESLYGYLCRRFLAIPHPRDWKKCLACNGAGSGCCRDRGFVVG